jgi:hypothetical protein
MTVFLLFRSFSTLASRIIRISLYSLPIFAKRARTVASVYVDVIIKSIGRIASKSIQNHPRKYLRAIILRLVMEKTFYSSSIEVKKFRTISTKKKPSVIR